MSILSLIYASNWYVQYIMIVFLESYSLLLLLCPLPYRNLSMKENDNLRVEKNV